MKTRGTQRCKKLEARLGCEEAGDGSCSNVVRCVVYSRVQHAPLKVIRDSTTPAGPRLRHGHRQRDQPDAMGGGEVIVDGTLPVSLRAAGRVALVGADSLEIKTFIGITSPSAPGTFSTMTCIGCAVHGVTVRPILDENEQ